MKSNKQCECGCGEYTDVCQRNDSNRGWVKGAPKRFINGHALRLFDKPVKYEVVASGCWEWRLHIRPDGYGSVKYHNKTLLAHRWMYQQTHSLTLSDTVFLDHLCRNRKCVNPEHLEPVTFVENIRRGSVPVISMEIARMLRREYAAGGTSQHRLARKHGINRATIAAVLVGKIWKESYA